MPVVVAPRTRLVVVSRLRRALTALVVALASAPIALGLPGACSCEEPLQELNPDVVVEPAALDLGRVRVAAPVAGHVRVGNRGTGRLSVVATIEGDSGFGIAEAPSSVGAGDVQDVVISFLAAAQGSYRATLRLTTDDADTPVVEVPITAEGGPPLLVVTPDPVDLGRVNEGQGGSVGVELRNDGLDVLQIRAVHLADGTAFSIPPIAASSLLPDERIDVSVSLFPDAAMRLLQDDDGLLHDTLVIEHGIDETREVPITASINLAPIAVAVEQDTRLSTVKVGVNKPVLIDGSDTIDPDGDAFELRWSLPSRPTGSTAALIGTIGPGTRVTPDVVGRYTVRLRATDVHGAFSDAVVEILPRDLALVLTWEAAGSAACTTLTAAQCDALTPAQRAEQCCGQSDLDLHLVAPTGVLGDYGTCPAACPDAAFCVEESDAHVDACRQSGLDCAFANRAPEWGSAGRIDDPRLDIDDVRGQGPEVISLNEPVDGTYRVVVHYCLDRILEPSVATVQVFEEGELLQTIGPQLVQEGQAWVAAALVRSSTGWQVISAPGVFDDTVPADLCAR